MKIIQLSLFFLVFLWKVDVSAQVAARESNVPESKSTISIHPIDIMANPQTLMKVWIDDPLPLSFYTPKEKESQIRINQNNTNGIITYSPLSSEMEWTGIDIEEITPFTWKWIDFEQRKADSSVSKIQLRRPHWWIREMHAEQIGNKVYLDMPEMGLRGYAEVKNIRVNQLDTRFWNENREGDYVSRPITGKFEHESNDVYYLHFGDNPHPLGVTGSHPIWSIDRNDWVGASELKIGEKVKTHDGLTVLHSRIKSAERQKVYNLEIYKDHNFLVSTDKILVHNTCTVNSLLKRVKGADPDRVISEQLKDMGRGVGGVTNNPGLEGIPGLGSDRIPTMTPREIGEYLIDLVEDGIIQENDATGFMTSLQKAFRGKDPNKKGR